MSLHEKSVLVVTSKTFIIVASILTFGIYYIYYLFCLAESHPNVFNGGAKIDRSFLVSEPKPKGKEEFERIDGGFRRLLSKGEWIIFLEQARKIIWAQWNRFLVLVFVFFSGALTSINRYWSMLSLKQEDQKREEQVKITHSKFFEDEEEERLSTFLSETTTRRKKWILPEFDFDRAISERVGLDHFKRILPNLFPTVFFWLSYFFFSLITLGYLPIRHWLSRDNKTYLDREESDLDNVHLDTFNLRIGRLMNLEQSVDFSSLLFGDVTSQSEIDLCSEVFKTRFFKDHKSRRLIIFLLMFFSLGTFGIYVCYRSIKGANNRSELAIKGGKPIITPLNKRDLIRDLTSFWRDIFGDIGVLFQISERKDFKLGEKFEFKSKTSDFFVSFFLKLVNYPMYFISFNSGVILVLSLLTIVFLSLGSLVSIITLMCLGVYLGLFSKHIDLILS